MPGENRRIAMTAVVAADGFIVGITEENIPGYVHDKREPAFKTWDEAHKRAEVLNAKLGLTPEEAFRIVGSSMHAALEVPGGTWKARG